MAQNQVYLIKSGENSFVEETQAIVGISGGKVGIGTTHPEADLHVSGDAQVDGNLTVKGNLTTVDATTIQVDDKNIELGVGSTTDAAADGGGITLHGATNKTFNWVDATDAWTSSENLSVADGKHFAGDELRALDADGLSLFDNNQSGITIKGGKVGIHQTAPVYDLDVDGSGNFTSLYVDGNSVLTGEGSIFGKWEDGATEGEIFYTGGNVGVGTINPEHKFHVVGSGVIDGDFVVNGNNSTFNVGEFDVSGSNITLNSAGGGLDSSRGGLIVNAGTNKTFQYVDGSDFWQSSESMQIVADKHLQTDKVRAIDDGGLYLQDDGENGIFIQDGGNVDIDKQLNIAGLTKANGGLNVGNGKFEVSSNGSIGDRSPDNNDVIKWNGTKWIAATSPGGGGSASSEVPLALSRFLDSGQSIHAIAFDDAPVGGYDNVPSVATDLEIVGEGSIIPYAISGLSNTGYYAVFSQDIPTENTYKLHTTFGGREVYWRTGEGGTSIYYDGDDVSVDNLTVGGNLTVNGTQTIVNTETLEIEDHNIVIASNTGYNQLTAEYPSVGDAYAGILWGTGDAGSASPVSLTYQSNKGFAFEGGYVGIGTTSPSYPLDVVGPIRINHVGSELFATIRGPSNRDLRIDIDANSGTDSFVVRDLRDGSERFLVQAGGNVGIGTRRPVGKLHVTDLSVSIGTVDVTNTGTDVTGGTSLNTKISNGDRIKIDNQIFTVSAVAETTLTLSGTPTNEGNFTAYTDNNALVVTSAGNVGIGTTSPDKRLEVVLEDDTAYGQGGTGRGIRVTNESQSALSYTSLELTGGQAGNSSIARIHAIQDNTTNASTSLAFALRTSSNSTAERMRINSAGNVGIGTTNPSDELHINSTTSNVNLRLTRDTDTGGRISCSDGADTPAIIFETIDSGNLSEKMRIDSAGNVGIGTSNPTGILHLEGDSPVLKIRSTDNWTATTGPVISFQGENSAGNTKHFAGIKAYSAGVELGELAFNVRKSNTKREHEAMRIDSDGNVGIGATSPGGKLHVTDLSVSIGTVNVTDTGTGVTNGTSLNTKISNGDRIKINGEIFTVSAVADTTLTLSGTPTSAGNFTAFTDNNALVITNAGNVGIGTTNPGAKLEVDYTAATQVGLTLNGSNSALNNAIKLTDASDNAITLSINAGKFGINGGNVGIGTTDPDGELHVNDGDSASQIFITSSDNSVAGLYLGDQTRGFRGGVIYNNSTDSLGLWGYAATGFTAQRMIIDSDGNVGIGTANPGSYKLNVNGTASVVHSSSGSQEVTSDDRVKHNEQPIVGALETLSKVTPKKYIKTTEMYDVDHDFELDADGNPVDENGEPVEHRVEAGVIAQQVLTVDELAFAVSPEGVDQDGAVTSPHGLDYNSLFTYAIAAIQEQQQLIDDLKSQNESLATRISALES